MDIKDINIKVGDKVIQADGLVGKVIRKDPIINDTWEVMFENGEQGVIHETTLNAFYLIGRTVLGNKIADEDLQKILNEQADRVKEEQRKYDQLRKQMWYLKYRMVDDWRERKEQHDKQKLDK